MNKMKRCLALLLVLCMTLSVMPFGVLAAEDSSYAYSIVHVDAGRKYFSPESMKTIIDNAAAAGFNQVELYLSDNQGFRFALDDMKVTTDYGTYDLTPALGDGYSDGSKYPDYSGKYLTQSEMTEIIAYANGKGIDIVPCINVPGHMGAILEEFTSFKYSGSNSSIDLNNDEAVAFALALTEKYAAYFASQGCKYYSVGADEYANDLSTMGFEGMGSTLYTKFVQFLNDAADIIIAKGMTPRAFNDGFYYKDYSISVEPNKAYEICYWSSGWSGYDVAAASTIAAKGHKMINTHGDYYWVLGNSSWQCSATKASQFDIYTFQGSTISDPEGAMFCIWCDVANTNGTDGGTAVAANTADVIAAFGAVLPETESLVSSGETVEDVTVSGNGVSVTAPGLTGLTVTETTAPTIEGASEVAAYDVAPVTAEGAYTGEATVTISVPTDWTNVRGGVMASTSGEEVLDITGKLENGTFTFTAPHFSDVVVYDVATTAEGETIDGGDIVLKAEAQTTKTISGVNYSGSYSVADPSVVSVAVTGQDAVEATVKYTAASVTCNNLISNNSTQVATGYYYTPDNGANYYPVYASRESERGWFSTTYTYTWYYSADNGSTFSQIGTQETTSTSTTANITVYTKSGTEGSPASTTITFTGLKPGTTTVTVGNYVYNVTVNYNEQTVTLIKDSTISYTQSAAITGEPSYTVSGIVEATISGSTVTFTAKAVGTTVATVGNTKYTITVTEEDLSKVTGLTVEYWITNVRVDGSDGAQSKTIAAADAYGVNGVELSALVAPTGTANGQNDVFWKGTRHASDAKQTTEGGDDKTTDGTDFVYIRYYGGNWAYSADRQTWTTVVFSGSTQSDQIVAYYLQKTTVTDEVTTFVVDWGPDYDDYTSVGNYVLLDFAVVYESGDRVPDSFPNKTEGQKTLGFHCDSSSTNLNRTTFYDDDGNLYRHLGQVMAQQTSQYDIYMITLTRTSDTPSTELSGTSASGNSSYTYDGTEKVVWVASEEDYDTTKAKHEDYSVGGDAVVPNVDIYNKQGMLITYYVRAKATEDALTVHYIDATEGANNLEFYSYNIAVKEGTYFHEDIALNTANPNGDLVNGDVTNYYGRTQTVSADLATLSQIGAQYLYTEYNCVWVERRDDKNVYLYYTFDPTVYFVADFGLPMVITATDLSDKLDDVTIKDMSFTGSNYSAYGKLTDNGTTVTYAPYKVMQGIDYFTLIVTTESAVGGILDEASTQIAFRVYVVPATTVYYEESFATATSGTWTSTGTANAGKQETELAASESQPDSKTVNYGYTDAYTAAGATNGTELVSTAAGNKAEITFTGTGIEIYANANTTTGTVAVLLYDSTDKLTKLYQVDTAAASGSSAATDNQNVDSYSLPIVSISGLTHGTYKIVLQHTGAGHDLGNIYLDGFRVHNTLNNLASTAYAASEQNPTFLELRNAVLTGLNITEQTDSAYTYHKIVLDEDGNVTEDTIIQIMEQVYNNEGTLTGALKLSGNDAVDAQDLLENGPKNELFLWPGESVTFNLGSAKAQIGLKALNGTVSYSITDGAENADATTGSITTSADMFYHDLTGTIVISNTGSNVLSVTKLKLFNATELQALTVEDVTYALSVMGYTDGEQMARPGAPIANPFADVAEGTWYYDAVMWAVKNGITTGADATHFLPEALCQRAAVVTFLWRAAGSPEPVSEVNPFVDVKEGDFFYKAVMWAVENGITNGSDATHFNPFGQANRAQVVTFLWRANGQPEVGAEIPFSDVAEGQWYTQAVAWAVANNITNGMSATEFGVNVNCNRAQIVTFLYRTSLIAA